MVNTSAMWQQAAHTTHQLSSPTAQQEPDKNKIQKTKSY